MKKILFVLFIFSITVLDAQESKPFSQFDIGFYGGINFYTADNLGGDFLVELKTNLLPSLKLKTSAGYSRTMQPYFYNVKTYTKITIVSPPEYFATDYNRISNNYDIFPLSLGFQYNLDFIRSSISPYISIDAVYNWINKSIETSPPAVWEYSSLDEVPAQFKGNPKKEKIVTNSYGVNLGVGISFPLSSKLDLDIRYLFKYDNEIINTNHFIVGIYF